MKFNETKSQERLINLMLQAGVELPNGCLYAAQDGKSKAFQVGGVYGYKIKPIRADDDQSWLPTGGDKAQVITRNISLLPNWHQTIITREQYEARDGWITWHGGECPVGGDTLVETMFGDGTGSVDNAGVWGWGCEEAQIKFYRIHKPADQAADDELYALPTEPCESVQRAIPVEPTIDELLDIFNDCMRKADEAAAAVDAALKRKGWD